MDDDFEDDNDFTMAVPANRARPVDFAIVVLGAIEEFFGSVKYILMSHANWSNDRQRMAREASEQIERMVSGE